MPKIIEDIEEKIFDVAFELFGEYGYKKVDMKMIAKKTGIAVGTLYNYYSNKKQLFISVFEKSWQSTFNKLDNIEIEGISPKEKIRRIITILYDEISARKGLGRELFKENILNKDHIDKILFTKEMLLNKIESLIKKANQQEKFRLEDGMERRLAETIFVLMVEIRMQHFDEREMNIRFINQLIDCVYEK